MSIPFLPAPLAGSRDYQALLAGVYAHPDADLPRLVLADWLDEHAGPMEPCAACEGHGKCEDYDRYREAEPPAWTAACTIHDPANRRSFCCVCNGTAVGPDVMARRAALIRRQCERVAGESETWTEWAGPPTAGRNVFRVTYRRGFPWAVAGCFDDLRDNLWRMVGTDLWPNPGEVIVPLESPVPTTVHDKLSHGPARAPGFPTGAFRWTRAGVGDLLLGHDLSAVPFRLLHDRLFRRQEDADEELAVELWRDAALRADLFRRGYSAEQVAAHFAVTDSA